MAEGFDAATSIVTTCVGPVRIHTMGALGTCFIALPGMGQGAEDWGLIMPTIMQKTSEAFRVVLPDPKSNASAAASLSEFAIVRDITTLRGLIRYTLHETWLLDLLPEDGAKVVLAGHSWGGGAACRFAVAHPERVSRLVLISPDVQYCVAQAMAKTGIPTLLIWNKNDPINPYCWRRRFNGHPSLTLITTSSGGHFVVDDHAEKVASWLNEGDVHPRVAEASELRGSCCVLA